MNRLRSTTSILLILLQCAATTANANEVCADHIQSYDIGTGDSTPEERQKVIRSCQHGRPDPFLKKMMVRCEKLKRRNHPIKLVEQCQIDAFRFIIWGNKEHPRHR